MFRATLLKYIVQSNIRNINIISLVVLIACTVLLLLQMDAYFFIIVYSDGHDINLL